MFTLRSRLAGFTLASAVAIASANAADMYRSDVGGMKDAPAYVPVQTWTGFYIGAHGGYQHTHSRTIETTGVDSFYGIPGDTFYNDMNDGFGGGQIGYNIQRGPFVLGIEGTISATGADKTAASPGFPSTDSYRMEMGTFGTVTGRLGYAFDRNLVYVKGGYAISEFELKGRSTSTTPVSTFRSSQTMDGYIVGAGVERAITPNWIGGIEYNYMDFGSDAFNATDNATPLGRPFRSVSDIDTHSVMGRLSYKFGSSYEPMK